MSLVESITRIISANDTEDYDVIAKRIVAYIDGQERIDKISVAMEKNAHRVETMSKELRDLRSRLDYLQSLVISKTGPRDEEAAPIKTYTGTTTGITPTVGGYGTVTLGGSGTYGTVTPPTTSAASIRGLLSDVYASKYGSLEPTLPFKAKADLSAKDPETGVVDD